MRLSTRTRGASAALALAGLAAAPADAQLPDSLYPLRAIDRPATLPRGVSRLDVLVYATRQPPASAEWTAILGGGVGVTNRLEVGGQLAPT